MKTIIILATYLCLINALRNQDQKVKTKVYAEADATFNKAMGVTAVQEANIGATTTKFSKTCADYISAKIGTTENAFEAWTAQKDKCDKHFLQAMVVFAIGAIDSDGQIIIKALRGELAFAIESLYLPISRVAYHNAVHAADLLEKYLYFFEFKNGDKTFREFTELKVHEYLAGALGAAGHDAGHPGDNNALDRIFITKSGTDYNGILENYSCDLTLATLLSTEENINKYPKYFFNLEQLLARKRKRNNVILSSVIHSKTKATDIKDEIIKNAKHGYDIVKNSKKQIYFVDDFLNSEVFEAFLGIARESIYTTNMNPFDTKTNAHFDKMHKENKNLHFEGDFLVYSSLANYLGDILITDADYKEYIPGGMTESTVEVKGMKNLNGQTSVVQAKWWLIGHVVHLSDLGNAYSGLKYYLPWYKFLMLEWAPLSCKKGHGVFIPYSFDQTFFQVGMVFNRVKHFNDMFQNWGWQSIVTSGMGSIDSGIKVIYEDATKEELEKNKFAKGPVKTRGGLSDTFDEIKASYSEVSKNDICELAPNSYFSEYEPTSHGKKIKVSKRSNLNNS